MMNMYNSVGYEGADLWRIFLTPVIGQTKYVGKLLLHVLFAQLKLNLP